jgi:methyltransferase (TIGR00027 family)
LAVAERRYIQSIHERPELMNPDRLVGHFLPSLRKWRCQWLSQRRIATLQADPIYYYLLARTRYYDSVFLNAIAAHVSYIINVGCGTDTRAYRFQPALKQKGIRVLECDQPKAIEIKQHLSQQFGGAGHVTCLSIDLNDEDWPAFEAWFAHTPMPKALVFMEGVAPYIKADTFTKFLRFLGNNLARKSCIAYDFKLRGFDESWRDGRTPRLFRLGGEREELSVFHQEMGFQVSHLEGSADLTTRLLTGLNVPKRGWFKEDMLIQLEVMN